MAGDNFVACLCTFLISDMSLNLGVLHIKDSGTLLKDSPY